MLNKGERDELEGISRSHVAPHSVGHRTQIVLASADGEANTAMARRLGVANSTVCHWRKKWFDAVHSSAPGTASPKSMHSCMRITPRSAASSGPLLAQQSWRPHD